MKSNFDKSVKKGGIIALSLYIAVLQARAQERSSVFNFLKIPVSAHVAALGGDNVSLKLDDPTLVFGNPATAAQVNDRSLNFNYMTYLSDSKVASAAFIKVFSVRHTVGLTGRLFDYGTMDETDEEGNLIGNFSARDMSVSALYSYTMGNGLVGGATMHFIFSKYAEFSSTAIGVDLGLHYYNDDNDFSAGIVMKNIGTQISSFFDDETEHLPFDLQLGITQKMKQAPFRVSLTLKDLTRWSQHYYYNPEEKNSLGRKIFNHVVAGVDFLPTENTYIALGCNFRRANELKAAGAGHGAGWSFGGGLQANRLKLGLSYAKYHINVSSVLFNISYSL